MYLLKRIVFKALEAEHVQDADPVDILDLATIQRSVDLSYHPGEQGIVEGLRHGISIVQSLVLLQRALKLFFTCDTSDGEESISR